MEFCDVPLGQRVWLNAPGDEIIRSVVVLVNEPQIVEAIEFTR